MVNHYATPTMREIHDVFSEIVISVPIFCSYTRAALDFSKLARVEGRRILDFPFLDFIFILWAACVAISLSLP